MRPILISLLLLLAAPLPVFAGAYEDILIAARDDRTDIVVNLVQRGMDPNTSDRSGTTLAMFAAASGNEKLLEFLLMNKCNILKQNMYGDTAVGIAALSGHLSIVRRLVDAGANLGGRGWNPLHYAAFNGHTDTLRFLLERRAPIDAWAPNRQTALMLATKNGHLEVVRLLTEANANMELADADGNTALSLAVSAGNTVIADFLRAKGALR
jgi:ankyrin repeat protein